jgi:DNA polymerase-3 subunit epsilon
MIGCPTTLVDCLDGPALRKLAHALRLGVGRDARVDELRATLRVRAREELPAFLEAIPASALKSLCRAHAFPETGERTRLASALAFARPWDAPRRFAALDFETANTARESACAVSLVVVDGAEVIDTFTSLVKPPRGGFQFTAIHGITARHVADAPSYRDVHGEVLRRLEGCAFVAAHNAAFDASVMRALCEWFALEPPAPPWRCTVKLARARWPLPSVRLPEVCRHLGIPLKHHDATSDATACARIVVAALS